MEKYKFKFNKTIKIATGIILFLCVIAIIFSILGIISAKITVDYVSNAFLLFINAVILFSVINYINNSNYKFTDSGIVVKTAYFKDSLVYGNIKKILFYATEDELYLELKSSSENLFHINIKKSDINDFIKEIKKHIPEISYEISLKVDSDLD